MASNIPIMHKPVMHMPSVRPLPSINTKKMSPDVNPRSSSLILNDEPWYQYDPERPPNEEQLWGYVMAADGMARALNIQLQETNRLFQNAMEENRRLQIELVELRQRVAQRSFLQPSPEKMTMPERVPTVKFEQEYTEEEDILQSDLCRYIDSNLTAPRIEPIAHGEALLVNADVWEYEATPPASPSPDQISDTEDARMPKDDQCDSPQVDFREFMDVLDDELPPWDTPSVDSTPRVWSISELDFVKSERPTNVKSDPLLASQVQPSAEVFSNNGNGQPSRARLEHRQRKDMLLPNRACLHRVTGTMTSMGTTQSTSTCVVARVDSSYPHDNPSLRETETEDNHDDKTLQGANLLTGSEDIGNNAQDGSNELAHYPMPHSTPKRHTVRPETAVIRNPVIQLDWKDDIDLQNNDHRS